LKKLCIGLAIASAMVAASELLCRAILGKEPVTVRAAVFAPLEHIGFGVAPNLARDGLTTSSLGTRGRELDPNAKKRILVLGDSMTFAIEVRDEETYCWILEKKLGAGTQVINSGCPGYGPGEELLMLNRLAPVVKPTHVLLMFFVANDLLDAGNNTGDTFRVIAGRLVDEAQYNNTSPGTRLLKNALARVWSFGLVRAVRLIGEGRQERREGEANGTCGMHNSHVRILIDAQDYGSVDEQGEYLTAKGWKRLPDWMIRIRDRCKSIGAELLVGILPLPLAFDGELRGRMAKIWNVPAESIDADRPDRKVAELLHGLGIATLEFAPVFRAAPNPAGIHLQGDPHLAPHGHAVIAEELAKRYR
jgi:hypothetical protein